MDQVPWMEQGHTEWRREATREREALAGRLAPGSRCWWVSRYCRVSSERDVTEEYGVEISEPCK